jgi:ribonuclease HI
MTQLSLWNPTPNKEAQKKNVARIEFDGGTSSNIPSLGYGDGYGSFRINNEPVRRLQFNRPMSANAAEIFTMAAAVKVAVENGATALVLVGDSQVALCWANRIAGNGKPRKHNGNMSCSMRDGIAELRRRMAGVMDVKTQWQPRERSFAAFGH